MRYGLGAALLAMVLLLPSAAAGAPARDPVLGAIDDAQAARAITPGAARMLRVDWMRSARARQRAHTSVRRAELAAIRAATIRLARMRDGLRPDRLQPALLGVRATTRVMLHEPMPAHMEEVRIPGEPAVFTYYQGRGVQLQPLETFKQCLRELNRAAPDVTAARAVADRMLELAAERGTSLTWEYFFAFGGPLVPWTSAMSQALATECYFRIADTASGTERLRYLAAADAAARSFLRAPQVGGVASQQGAGNFYVMYSFHPRQRILNGHLQVLVNLDRYARATGSALARRVVNAGVAAVEPLLPSFDTGAWSRYQPGQEARLDYHELQTGQLGKLAEQLDNATFARFAGRFASYLTTPPTITPAARAPMPIVGAADGHRDTTSVIVTVDKPSRSTLVVRDQASREVARTSVSGGSGRRVLVWDGTVHGGRRAAAGTYSGSVTVTDLAGNRSRVELALPLRVVADTVAPQLRRITLRARGDATTQVAVDSFDAASGWILTRLRLDGRTLASTRAPRSGRVVLRVARPAEQLRRGELVLRDSSGNELVHRLGES